MTVREFHNQGESEVGYSFWQTVFVWRTRGRGMATPGWCCWADRPPSGIAAVNGGSALLATNENFTLKVLQGVIFLNGNQ